MADVMCFRTGQILYTDPKTEYLTYCGCFGDSDCPFLNTEKEERDDEKMSMFDPLDYMPPGFHFYTHTCAKTGAVLHREQIIGFGQDEHTFCGCIDGCLLSNNDGEEKDVSE